MVYGFVKQSGGHITIYSELDHGTTFNIYLPRSGKGLAERPSAANDDASPLRRGVVLVVEDDPGVRELTVSRLKAIGYKVVEAVDGRKAAEVLKSREPIKPGVFTDLVMPGGVSGRDVAALARELRPGTKILLTSGYAEDPRVRGSRTCSAQNPAKALPAGGSRSRPAGSVCLFLNGLELDQSLRTPASPTCLLARRVCEGDVSVSGSDSNWIVPVLGCGAPRFERNDPDRDCSQERVILLGLSTIFLSRPRRRPNA